MLKKIKDAVVNLIQKKAEETEARTIAINRKISYDNEYFTIAAGLADLYADIEQNMKFQCFNPYNIAVISQDYQYVQNTMGFAVPYVIGLTDAQRNQIEMLIKQGLARIISYNFVKYSKIDVFASGEMSIVRTKTGFQLKLK